MTSLERTPKEVKDLVCKLYSKDLFSINAIARKTELSQGLVHKILKEAGIEARSKSQSLKLWNKDNRKNQVRLFDSDEDKKGALGALKL